MSIIRSYFEEAPPDGVWQWQELSRADKGLNMCCTQSASTSTQCRCHFPLQICTKGSHSIEQLLYLSAAGSSFANISLECQRQFGLPSTSIITRTAGLGLKDLS